MDQLAATPLTIDKNPVPFGEMATIHVGFQLAPAQPDIGPISIQLLTPGGAVAASIDNVVLKGVGGETAPVVDLGAAQDPTHWTLVAVGGGTLSRIGAYDFQLGR